MLDQPWLTRARNWEAFTSMVRHTGVLIQCPIFRVTDQTKGSQVKSKTIIIFMFGACAHFYFSKLWRHYCNFKKFEKYGCREEGGKTHP